MSSELIEKKIDRNVAGALTVSQSHGGMLFESMGQVMEFAKVMAIGGVSIPPHLRNNPGACLAVCIQAVEWRMSPYAVANKSYSVNDRLAYESQLIHAVIEQRAPLVGRLRHRFDGEGDARTCTVWATAVGEPEPLSYTSPPIGKITPKNSPLWKTKPDLQLYYNASRDWARMYFPDVILGVYSDDELDPPPARVMTAPPKTLSELVAKSQPVALPGTSTAEPTPQPPTPPLSPLEAFRSTLATCDTEAAARDLYESAAHPDGPMSEADATEAAKLFEERLRGLKQ